MTPNPYIYTPPKWPRCYQMGRCKKCRRRYRLPMSADPKIPALAQCDRCWSKEMKALSDELARATGKANG